MFDSQHECEETLKFRNYAKKRFQMNEHAHFTSELIMTGVKIV